MSLRWWLLFSINGTGYTTSTWLWCLDANNDELTMLLAKRISQYIMCLHNQRKETAHCQTIQLSITAYLYVITDHINAWAARSSRFGGVSLTSSVGHWCAQYHWTLYTLQIIYAYCSMYQINLRVGPWWWAGQVGREERLGGDAHVF